MARYASIGAFGRTDDAPYPSRRPMRNTLRGMSLIETFVVVGIAVMLIGALVNMYLNYNKFYERQQREVDVTQSARRLANRVHTSVLQADAVVSSHAFSGTTYTTSSSTLVLELPAANA